MANGTLNALAVADVAMLAGTVMLADPLKLVPFIVRAVCRVVAVAALPVVEEDVVALPLKDAVIVPAEKLPEASRATTFEAVLADVASTAHVVAAEPLKFDPVR